MQAIWRMSAVETARATRSGRLTCTDVVEAHCERLRAVNPGLNAVTVDLGESALDTARALDAAFRAGVASGPLHGVPVTIKENVDVAGQANPNGVPGLAGVIAPDDSPVARNLKRAGAVIIGRTNTPEFSFRAFTDNPLRGLTRNPWDPEGVTCGGSSGGAAASVAAGVGAIAHGNDIGGSLRIPAWCCGCATIRPTLGRVPAWNSSQTEERALLMQMMSVQGPIAREVRDVRLGLAAMAEADPRDPLWVPAPLEGPRLPHPIRVAVAESEAHPAVRAALDRAADALAGAGYAVEAAEPPEVDRLLEVWYRIVFADFRVTMEDAVRRLGSPEVNRIVDAYFSVAGPVPGLDAYVRDLAERNRLLRAWSLFLEDYPLVLAPVSTEPPFPVNDDLGGPERVREIFHSLRYTSGMNLLGLPGAVAPTGLHGKAPIGVQIVGRRYREDVCLDAAQAIENSVGVLCERLWARERAADSGGIDG